MKKVFFDYVKKHTIFEAFAKLRLKQTAIITSTLMKTKNNAKPFITIFQEYTNLKSDGILGD